MNQIELALQLDQLVQTGPTIYLKLEPEVVDFTRLDSAFDLVLMSKSHKLAIEINTDNAMEMLALLKAAILEDKKLTIIGWNIKNLFTYSLARTGGELEYESKLLDLKLAECFIGIRDKAPADFVGVVQRLRKVFADSSWAKFKGIFQKVYLPLLSRAIPKIEVEGVFETEKREILYPYYEIEGQVGGRLSTQMVYEHCFNPHSISEIVGAKLGPRGNDLVFLSFDYHFHEVCVLAWLSQDEVLLALVNEEDFYREVYKRVMGEDCDTDEKRAFCKDFLFLPVVYGQQAKTLSERAAIGVELAQKLIDKLRSCFPKLFSWVDNHVGENGVYTDFIGRKRHFPENEEYKYRNFIVQSPGAIFSLDRLVHLSDKLGSYGRVVAHIHDGFVVCCVEKQAEVVRSICLKSLEGESVLFPGLKLRTNCKISKTLA